MTVAADVRCCLAIASILRLWPTPNVIVVRSAFVALCLFRFIKLHHNDEILIIMSRVPFQVNLSAAHGCYCG